ncbi:MAG: hypothetical protein FWG34_08930 [Oscillospiraceae bacterium]|nr:hypothetical protein [Oscillospiraceae bacterium]
MNFSDAKNSGSAVKIIKEMIKTGKIPGAFIFEGENGEEKKIISEVLAKSIVCQNSGHKNIFGEACGKCPSCAKAEKSIHPDIIVSKPEGEGSLSFHIEKAREIIEGLYLAPNDSDAKAYIIQDMQNMTPQAQNALLKSLEEPPPFAVFIITASSADLLLETVKSRAVRFALDSKGSPATKSGRAYEEHIAEILAKKTDKLPAYQKLASKIVGKPELIDFYSFLENALRDILIAKISNPEKSGEKDFPLLYFQDLEIAKEAADAYTAEKILDLENTVRECKADLDYNVNMKLNLACFFGKLNRI